MNSNKRINLLVDLVKLALIILIACVLVSVIVFIVSDDPWTAISSFFLGPFTSLRRVGNIIEAASPLMFTALAVIIIFGSGQFSMIAEGSFFIGITGAMVVAIACKLPGGVHPAAAILFGGFCGAAVALVPALLKMKWNVSELVTSIMFNYVVQFFAIYMVSYHFREVSSSSLASWNLKRHPGFPLSLTEPESTQALCWESCFVSWYGFSCTAHPWGPGSGLPGTIRCLPGMRALRSPGSWLRPRSLQGPSQAWEAERSFLACITGLSGPQPPDMGGQASWLRCWPEAIRCWFLWQLPLSGT